MRSRSLNWLIAGSLLFLALVPFHLHLHHGQMASAANPAAATTVDVHIATDMSRQAHHNEAVIMQVVPDALIPALDDHPLPLLLLGVLLTVLPVVLRNPHRIVDTALRPLSKLSHFLTPPLRAPPRS